MECAWRSLSEYDVESRKNQVNRASLAVNLFTAFDFELPILRLYDLFPICTDKTVLSSRVGRRELSIRRNQVGLYIG